jgi:ABC-type phosphate/phosphonate transport system substrate-binding protein
MTRHLNPGILFYFLMAGLLLPRIVCAQTLTIGTVGRSPTEQMQRILPIANFLAAQLKTQGFNKGEFVFTNSPREMVQHLVLGKVDLYFGNAFSAAAMGELSGSKLLLRRWKRGIAEYESVFFTKKTSSIKRLEDFNGKIIALEYQTSATGYLLPKLFLLKQGFKLIPKKQLGPVSAKEVGYIFTNDDENTMAWVLTGKLSAGAMSQEIYLKEARGEIDKLTVVGKTFSIPRNVVSHRKGLPQKLVTQIKNILINMAGSDEGKKVLHEFEETSQFDEITAATAKQLVEMGKWAAAELELK